MNISILFEGCLQETQVALPGAFLPVGHPGRFDGRGVRRDSEESAHEDQAQHLSAGLQDFQETLQDAWMGKAMGKNLEIPDLKAMGPWLWK